MAAKKKKNVKKESKENLKSWKPGQSGNPNGRPKGTVSITTQIKLIGAWQAPKEFIKELQQIYPQLPDNASSAQVLAVKAWIKAFDSKTGDAMTKEILERIDGKVPLPIGGAPEVPPINVKHDLSSLDIKELGWLDKILNKIETPDE